MARIFQAEELPRLRSTRDKRKRVDLVTQETVGAVGLRGDLIVYPPQNEGSPHYHPDVTEVKLVLRGSGTFFINGVGRRLRAGDLVVLRPDDVHHFRTEAQEDLAFVEFWIPGDRQTVWVNPEDP